jgi:hypothetical protein
MPICFLHGTCPCLQPVVSLFGDRALVHHAAPAIATKGKEGSGSRAGSGTSGLDAGALERLGDTTSRGMKESMEILGSKMENIEQKRIDGDLARLKQESLMRQLEVSHSK